MTRRLGQPINCVQISWAEKLRQAGWWVTLKGPGAASKGYALRGAFFGDAVRIWHSDAGFWVQLLGIEQEGWHTTSLDEALQRADTVAGSKGGWADVGRSYSTYALFDDIDCGEHARSKAQLWHEHWGSQRWGYSLDPGSGDDIIVLGFQSEDEARAAAVADVRERMADAGAEPDGGEQ